MFSAHQPSISGVESKQTKISLHFSYSIIHWWPVIKMKYLGVVVVKAQGILMGVSKNMYHRVEEDLELNKSQDSRLADNTRKLHRAGTRRSTAVGSH